MISSLFETLLALVVFSVIFIFAYRGYRQGVNRLAIAVKSPPGIQFERYIPIGGIEQWISVRGEDVANPVLLFVHGGPGNAMSGLTYHRQRPFEAHFTVVQWDQRGAGKTYARHGKTGAGEMTIDRIVEDGIAVAEWLRTALDKDKIVLLGLSWGSLLGTEMVVRRPDLFSAYVGTGQVVAMQAGEAAGYDALMARLEARGDAKAVAALAKIGPPPYPSRKALIGQRRILFKAGSALDRATMRELPTTLLFAPSLSLRDVWANLAANFFSIAVLYDALMAYDIRRLGTRFEIPMLYIQGADDIQTPTSLVEAYVAEIEAPKTRLALIEGGAHMAVVTHVDAFLEAMREGVGRG